MNQLMLVIVVLVAFVYFGGSNVPKVLRNNKEILLGLAGGLVLCSFFGLRLEGFKVSWGKVEYNGNSAGDCIAKLLPATDPDKPKERRAIQEKCRQAYMDRRSNKATAHAGTIAAGEASAHSKWWHHLVGNHGDHGIINHWK